jgi:hypothetical protein
MLSTAGLWVVPSSRDRELPARILGQTRRATWKVAVRRFACQGHTLLQTCVVAGSACRTPHHLASEILGHLHRLSEFWIEGCVGFEHGASGGEEAVGDAA